jgi:RimJ/RimL family protein N-acetyltransferase
MSAVTLHTSNYIVRTLTPDDANEQWTQWLLDPTAIQMLNAKPQQLTLDALRGIIRSFDSKTRYLLGIFDTETGELVGIRAHYVNLKEKEWIDNVLIGPNGRRKNAQTESRQAAYRYFFENLGLVRVRCAIVAENKLTIALALREGFILEQTTMRASRSGGGVVELLHFRLNRETWRRNEAGRLARSA